MCILPVLVVLVCVCVTPCLYVFVLVVFAGQNVLRASFLFVRCCMCSFGRYVFSVCEYIRCVIFLL